MPFQKGHKGFRTKKSYQKQGKEMLGHFVSEKTKKILSSKLMGRKFSDEFKRKDSERMKKLWEDEGYRQRMVEAHKGQKAWNKDKEFLQITGKKHWNWKGDNVGYSGLHLWVKKVLGKPKKCEHCDKNGLKGAGIHWANKSGEYKRDVNDWIRLCVPCHSAYDKNNSKLLDSKF